MRGLVLRLSLSHIIKSRSGWFELMTLLQTDEYVNGNVRPGFSPTLFNSPVTLGAVEVLSPSLTPGKSQNFTVTTIVLQLVLYQSE